MFAVTLMSVLLLAVSVTCQQAGLPAVDPNVLTDIFGKPPDASTPSVVNKNKDPLYPDIFGTPPTVSTVKYEDITVKPTEGTVTGVDSEGKSCQCVPYYLCDTNGVSTADDPDVTGFGLLDIRFGEDQPRVCQESVELCCTSPKPVTDRPIPDKKDAKSCGYRNPDGLGIKLSGGTGSEAEYGEFPWVVAIMDGASNDKYLGVGVIIHPQVIMTGAHIAAKAKPGNMKIRAGEWDTQTIKEMYDHQERIVDEIYSHEAFGKLLINDVALLRLATPLDFGPHIYALCLPTQGEDFSDSKKCISNGWGKDKFGLKGRYAVIMKKVEQDIVPYSTCNAQLKKTRLGPKFNLPRPSLLCAGGEAGVDTCEGDGGGPLACPIGDNRYKLAGLVAWGIDCGKKDVPAVFAKVSEFRAWVDDKMNEWGYGPQSYNIF